MKELTQNEYRDKTIHGFTHTIIGVIFPFIISFIGIVLIKQYAITISFVDEGQILLFAVGLLTNSYYIFQDQDNLSALKKKSIRLYFYLNPFILLSLVVSSVLYGLLFTINISHSSLDINYAFIRIISIIIFLFSAYSSYKGIEIDLLKNIPIVDVQKESNNEIQDLIDLI